MIVACVRVGNKYGLGHVVKLRNCVRRNMGAAHRFVCLTDRPSECVENVESIDIRWASLGGWWAKMALFAPSWRRGEQVVYFDLDVVPVGPLDALTHVDVPFAVCESFARLSGNVNWPCKYNSSVMVINSKFGGALWNRFVSSAEETQRTYRRYGDQKALEDWGLDLPFLQSFLPQGFFLGWRELYGQHRDAKPDDCSVVVFAGAHKPDSPDAPAWVQEEWTK